MHAPVEKGSVSLVSFFYHDESTVKDNCCGRQPPQGQTQSSNIKYSEMISVWRARAPYYIHGFVSARGVPPRRTPRVRMCSMPLRMPALPLPLSRTSSFFEPVPYDIYPIARDPVDDELRSLVGAILIPGALPLAPDNVAHYENCLIQRICFQLHQWRPRSRSPPSRIVILDADCSDSDCSIQGNLDTLYALPGVDHHPAPPPRAYWIDRHPVDSTWMLVTLSGRLWIDDAFASFGPGIYDMDPDQV